MTQLIVYKSNEGILVCTDSAATMFDDNNAVPCCFRVQKLFQITPGILMATAGAGYGLAFCASFQKYIRGKGLWSYEDVAMVALPFLRSEFQRFRNECDERSAIPDVERVYFIIAGVQPGPQGHQYRFSVIASDSFQQPLHFVKVPHFVVIPRKLALEYRLNGLPRDTALYEVEKICRKYLVKLANESAEVAPPFDFVRISKDGIRKRTLR